MYTFGINETMCLWKLKNKITTIKKSQECIGKKI